jgi:hypothetical protein
MENITTVMNVTACRCLSSFGAFHRVLELRKAENRQDLQRRAGSIVHLATAELELNDNPVTSSSVHFTSIPSLHMAQ